MTDADNLREIVMTEADSLREIAVEIERYNHMKAAKRLIKIAAHLDATETRMCQAIVATMTYSDELNLMLGLALGQLLKEGISPDERLIAYLKDRGLLS